MKRLLIPIAVVALIISALSVDAQKITPAPWINGSGAFTPGLFAPAADNCATPPYSFQGDTNTGVCSAFADFLTMWAGGLHVASFNNTTGLELNDEFALAWSTSPGGAASDVLLGRGAANLLALASGDSFNIVSGSLRFANVLGDSGTAPTISSGFGTSPSIVASNGTLAFSINVGTGGTANSGVIGFPAATTGWRVTCDDVTTQSATVFLTKQTATSTTTATVGNFDAAGAAAAWVASNILVCSARAF